MLIRGCDGNGGNGGNGDCVVVVVIIIGIGVVGTVVVVVFGCVGSKNGGYVDGVVVENKKFGICETEVVFISLKYFLWKSSKLYGFFVVENVKDLKNGKAVVLFVD